ncbi:MAG: MBOAT family protein [Lachnospiraceae bacterium]|nr:MBOAT family protein [Lachnospiraceae bacterium]
MSLMLSFTSIKYLIFLLGVLVLYYILPRKIRWIGLLAGNALFLYKSNSLKELLIWLAMAALTYLAALGITLLPKEKGKLRMIVMLCGVFLLVTSLVLLQASTFFGLPDLGLSPLGISYYTLSWIAYLCEAYWGTGEAQKNPLKFLTFAGFFPLLTSGPIVRYREVGESITSGNGISYENLTNGAARIAWGFMKKLVIADRISVFVNTVYGNPYRYPGAFFIIADAFFVIQLYADFSGCIDIALGSAEMFGIKLPENFEMPFLSQTLEEFWRKWHITLGGFLRDFVLYPLLKSAPMQAIGRTGKKLLGKKTGKKLPTWIGLMLSWFLVGFWHGGGWNYIFGVGIFYGFIIIMGDVLSPFLTWLVKLLRINTEAFSWKAFRVVRTWFFFGFGLSFFRAGNLMDGFRNMKLTFTIFNPWIFFTGELYELGLDRTDFNILAFFLGLLILSGILRALSKKSIRALMAEQNLIFRWALYALLVYAVIIYGCYGTGFDSASFIYQGF